MLEFYNSDEKGFSHIKGEGINMMADSQCIYALVSLYRQLNDMGRLFDFTKKETALNTKEPPEKNFHTTGERYIYSTYRSAEVY